MAQDVTERMPDYLVSMVRRSAPPDCQVVPGSTPVVAFGDPTRARIATLGINPSRQEFTDTEGRLLRGADRRLSTLESLNADSCTELTDVHVATVVEACANYFGRNPYSWFNRLDRVLRAATSASYSDRTACHLDLVQWATDPVWSGLGDGTRRTLLADGVPHLRAQLSTEQIRTIVLNGAEVIRQVDAVGLADLRVDGTLPLGDRSFRLYMGAGSGVRWFGWSVNLQSTPGVSNIYMDQLAEWLGEAVRR